MNNKKSGCGCSNKSSAKSEPSAASKPEPPAVSEAELSKSVVIPTEAYSDVPLNGDPPRVAAVPAANRPGVSPGRAASETLAASADRMVAPRSTPRSKPVFLGGMPFTGVK